MTSPLPPCHSERSEESPVTARDAPEILRCAQNDMVGADRSCMETIIKETRNLCCERKAAMDKQTLPTTSEQPPRQSLRQKIQRTLILWGILAPPGTRETSLTAEEQATRKRVFFQFRRHPGGR